MGTIKTINYNQGELLNAPQVQRSGFIFKGWFDQPVGGNPILDDDPASGNATYYAKWEEEPLPEEAYAIKYTLNNKNASLKSGTKTSYLPSELPYNVPNLATTTQKKYGNDPDVKKICTFNTWLKNENGTWVQSNEIQVGETGNKEFKGSWQVRYENSTLPIGVEINGKKDSWDGMQVFPKIPSGNYRLKFNDKIWASHYGAGGIGFHSLFFYISLTAPGTYTERKRIAIPISAVVSSHKSTSQTMNNSIHPVQTSSMTTSGFSTNGGQTYMEFTLNEIAVNLTETCDICLCLEKTNSKCDGGKLDFYQSNRNGTATLRKV